MYSRVCANTGWTWDYVRDHVDIPRLEAMNKYWEYHPPVQVMIAAYFGIKPESKPKKMSEAEVAQLMQQFPQG